MAEKGSSEPSLLQWLIASGLIGGGQTHEQIQYDTNSQVRVQVYQAFTLLFSIAGTVAGLWLLTAPLAWLVGLASSSEDLVVLAVGLALLVTVGRMIVRWLVERFDWELPDLLWRVLEVVVLIVWQMLGVTMLQVWLDQHWGVGETVRFIAGLGLTVSGGLLSWRFVNELFNPLFPKSPTTTLLEDLIDAITPGEERPQVVLRGPIPTRINGQPAIPVVPQMAQLAGTDLVMDESYGLFVDLLELVERAQVHGLTREAHLTRPRLRLPSGEPLTRGRYDALIEYGTQWGIFQQHGRGITATWGVVPEQALAMLRDAWHREVAGQTVPSPTASLPGK